MAKRQVQDDEKLEAVGMKGHDTFIREYDISFHYDPAFALGLVTETPATTTATSVPVVQTTGGHHAAGGRMTVTLSVRQDGENVTINAEGVSTNYNPMQSFQFRSFAFMDLRLADLLDKFDDTWPKFERGGHIVNSHGKEDSISNRSKLETIGIKPGSQKYTLIFEIDPNAPPPKSTPKPAEKPSIPASVGGSIAAEKKLVSEPRIRNISIQSDDTEHHTVTKVIEKEEDFTIDVELVPVSYRVNIRTSANNTARLELNEADFALSIDELLKKANIPWSGTKKGQLSSDASKKPISSNESLQRLGMKPASSSYNLSFKIPTKTTVTTTTQSRPVKPHKTGTFEQLKLDFRVFLDEGDIVQVNTRAQGRDFKGDSDMAVKSAEFNRWTIEDLISKFPRRWPILEPEGWLQTTEKTVAFNGTDKLTAIGIEPNPNHTNSYNLVFPVSDEKPHYSTNDFLVAKERASLKYPSAGNLHRNSNTTNTSGIAEGTIGVNVRIFYDEPYYNLQLNGVAGDLRVETDLSLRKTDYENLTFGELKKKLRRWPETASAGKFHSQSGNINFSDSDKPFAVGIVAPDDGKPTIHQFSWELK